MRKKAFALPELLIVLGLSVIFLIIIMFAIREAVLANKSIESRTQVGIYTSILTIEHEGHKFIIVTKNDGVALLHHPDCNCYGLAEVSK